jgi:hypothetical protein
MSRTHERWFFPIVAASIVAASPASADAGVRSDALLSRSDAWGRGSLVALGRVRTDATPLESAGNILALYVDRSDALSIRVSLVAPVGIRDRQNYYAERGVRTFVLIDEGPGGEERLPAPLSGPAPFAWDRMLELRGGREVRALAATARGESGPLEASNFAAHLESGWLAAVMPPGERAPIALAVLTWADGRELDRLVAPYGSAVLPSGETNVAFVHHANQGLAYTDNFKGRFGAESTSGYDEILRVHEQKNIPGNFHVGTLLQTQAEWSYRNGDPLDFNGWLRTGVTNGWAGMLCSAYGQPIMPFLQGAMNDWAISRDHDMVNTTRTSRGCRNACSSIRAPTRMPE